jgi:phospholipid/cholesterol/gamma-HCH transport system permease protein
MLNNVKASKADAEFKGNTLCLCGNWTIRNAATLETTISKLKPENISDIKIDGSVLQRLDTSGAWLIVRWIRERKLDNIEIQFQNMPKEAAELIEIIWEEQVGTAKKQKREGLMAPLVALGKTIRWLAKDIVENVGFLGQILSAFARDCWRPSRWRPNALVTQIDKAGFKAVPIIILMNFIIGAIVAQQSAFQLRFFGAEIFVVDLVGILVFRELGVLISAIMVAGRTGSSYTAEIGSMKMREEIDAMRVMGLDPISVLVLPRILGLIIALPLLTFIANMAAIAGAMLVVWGYSDIPPTVFIDRMKEAVWLETVMVGFIKAPFLALTIGLIACVEGLRVKGSAESLGAQVTASVVKAIFLVIVMDGVFAIFFAAIDY